MRNESCLVGELSLSGSNCVGEFSVETVQAAVPRAMRAADLSP